MKNKELAVGEEMGVDWENPSQTAPSRTPRTNLSGFNENPILPVFWGARVEARRYLAFLWHRHR